MELLNNVKVSNLNTALTKTLSSCLGIACLAVGGSIEQHIRQPHCAASVGVLGNKGVHLPSVVAD